MTPAIYNERLLKAKSHALQTLEALCDPLPDRPTTSPAPTTHDQAERRLALQDRANRIRAANDILRTRPVNDSTPPPGSAGEGARRFGRADEGASQTPQDPAPTTDDAPPSPASPQPTKTAAAPTPRRNFLYHPFDGIEGWNNGQGSTPCILKRFPSRSSRAP